MKPVIAIFVLTFAFGCKTMSDSVSSSTSSSRQERILNYQNTYACPTAEVYSPESAAEVSTIVKKAIAEGKTVMAGTRRFRSQIDAACTSKGQIQVTTENLKEIHIDGMLARAQAGVTLGELGEALAAKGLSINMISEGRFFSVGGMLGSGTHGSTLQQGASLEEYVTKVTIVDGLGNLQEVSDPSDLRALRVNLGVLGVIVDATFKVESLKKVRASFTDKDDSNIAQDILRLAKDNYSASISWFPGLSSYAATLYNFVPNETEGDAVNAQAHVDENALRLFEVTFKLAHGSSTGHLGCTLATVRKGLRTKSYFNENDRKVDDPVGWSHKMQYFTCNEGGPCPWDVLPIVVGGVSIPTTKLVQWIDEAKKIHKAYSSGTSPVCFPLNGIYFRFAKGSDAHIALNSGQQTVFIDLEYAVNTTNMEVDGEQRVIKGYPQHFQVYQELMHMSLDKFQARPHWGKNYADAFYRIGSRQYSKWPEFLKAKRKFDPNGIFTNDWWKRVSGPSDEGSVYGDGCGIFGDCICLNDSHCMGPYKCQKGLGYPEVNVCRP